MFKSLKAEIDSFFSRDPAAGSRLEVVLCYPGFHAVCAYRVSHWLWLREWSVLARFISQFMRWITGIEIHPGATIGHRLFIDHGTGVVIGQTAKIGDDVTIYHDVTLGGVSPENSDKGSLRHPQLGNGVIVGSGAQLLGPIRVGDYARIGSNAVVVRDVADHATMVGIPARDVSSRVKGRVDEHFEAYGVVHGDVPDPVARSMEHLLQEIEKLKARVAELESEQQDAQKTAQQWSQPS